MLLGSSADRRTNWVRLRNLTLPSADVTDEDFDFLVCLGNHEPARLDLETNHPREASALASLDVFRASAVSVEDAECALTADDIPALARAFLHAFLGPQFCEDDLDRTEEQIIQARSLFTELNHLKSQGLCGAAHGQASCPEASPQRSIVDS